MEYKQTIKSLYDLPENENYGYKENTIIKVEDELNIKFPKILREYYLTLGKNKNINNTAHGLFHLFNPNKIINFFNATHYLVFCRDNYAWEYYGIKKKDIEQEDPVVCAAYNNGIPKLKSASSWSVFSPTTSRFLLSMAFWNGPLGGLTYKAGHYVGINEKEKLIEHLENNWKEIPWNETYQNRQARFYTLDYSEIIVFSSDAEMTGSSLFIGTNNQERYNNMREKINVKWDS
jgi:hypothetical protein